MSNISEIKKKLLLKYIINSLHEIVADRCYFLMGDVSLKINEFGMWRSFIYIYIKNSITQKKKLKLYLCVFVYHDRW